MGDELIAGLAEIVPEPEIGGLPLRIGAILLASRLGAQIGTRILGWRRLMASTQDGREQHREDDRTLHRILRLDEAHIARKYVGAGAKGE
jgi:hypothetical protein